MEHLQVCWVKAMLKAKICETFGKGLESANSRTDATPGYFENSQQSNRLVSGLLKQTVLAVAATLPEGRGFMVAGAFLHLFLPSLCLSAHRFLSQFCLSLSMFIFWYTNTIIFQSNCPLDGWLLFYCHHRNPHPNFEW